jgi:hypothetical protein
MWAGPATGATREMALTRLVAQLEDLGIYYMNREKAENVLDDFDDDGGSGPRVCRRSGDRTNRMEVEVEVEETRKYSPLTASKTWSRT